MSETLLTALMKLFAIFTDLDQEKRSGEARYLVQKYLERHFNTEYAEQYLLQFDYFLNIYHNSAEYNNAEDIKRVKSENYKQVIEICSQLNLEMEQEQKILLFIQLLKFLKTEDRISSEKKYFIDTLSKKMIIDEDDYNNLKAFILKHPLEVEKKQSILVVSGENKKDGYKRIYNEKQQTTIWILHIESTNTYIFKYEGVRNLYLNGHAVRQKRSYVLALGAVIKTSLMPPIYYSTVASEFLELKTRNRIIYRAIDIEYKFNANQTAIHQFSLLGRSGQLIGVLGGSGSGKSTLLNLLNGNLKPSHGRININGYDLHKNKEDLNGLIGYVPQEDLLIEELTVFENLYFNARLCFSDIDNTEITKIVNKAIDTFDLTESKDLVVGSPLKKILSGGQRKRLNIALELIRQPSILFVDEPTSGLSSMDSEKVMSLLKRQAIKGKLVIINIHQPSSDLYKLFDKLLIIDKGGRIIHNGNPMDAIQYFKQLAKYVNPEYRECSTCGNVKTEQVLRIIEARMVNTRGKLIRKRKTTPEEWYEHYRKNFEDKFIWKKNKNLEKKEELPPNQFNVPKRLKQFSIFFMRDALSKLKDKQYLLINFLEAPLLALILGFFTKYIVNSQAGGEYIFAENVNLPAYLFMSVVVALFLGLNVSAEEIIKDRKLLKRESFLNLSRLSYLNSKIVILFLISALQTFMFVLIGNEILEIENLNISYWLILFTLACHANMLGLNISSGLNSVISIYILIPLILVPQMLFSGVIVEFDKLHSSIASEEYVPIIGDVMASRWGYEALAVNQFKNNKFESYFFEEDKKLSNTSYYSSLLIPVLTLENDETIWNHKQENNEKAKYHLTILAKEIPDLAQNVNMDYPIFNENTPITDSLHQAIDKYLIKAKSIFTKEYKEYSKLKDQEYNKLTKKLGSTDAVMKLKRDHYNKSLAMFVKDKKEIDQIVFNGKRYRRKKDPIFQKPISTKGRAQFYSCYKILGSVEIPTPLFNMIAVWISTILLYITLYFDLLRKVITYIENFKLRKETKRLWGQKT